MASHKIVKIPDWVLPDDEDFLNTLGNNGWELVHVYNQHAYLKAGGAGSPDDGGNINPAFDSFGRQRTSQQFTLGDYKSPYGQPNTNILLVSSSGASITSNPFKSSGTLAVSGSSGSYAIAQSKKYHNYLPGKSQLIYQSFLMNRAVSGSIKRVGYFDDLNGIFLEQDQTGSLNWVIRSNASGDVQEIRARQSDWNVNTLLSSPFVLDVTKVQLIAIDFQWLGVGRVRCGFSYKGTEVLTHVFDHVNFDNMVYMAQPNLPIRAEVRSALNNSTGSLELICASVQSEGGFAETGRTWAVSTPGLRSITSGSTVGVLAIRLKNNFNGYPNRGYVISISAELFATDRSQKYRLLRLPNQSYITTGSNWTSVSEDSIVEYNSNISAFTDGREILNGFVAASGTGTGNFTSARDVQQGNAALDNYIAQNYSSTDSEIYILAATNLTADTTTIGGGLQWHEIY